MRAALAFAVILACLYPSIGKAAVAPAGAMVVQNCGALPSPQVYTPNNTEAITVDTTGNLCDKATTSPGSVTPVAGTASAIVTGGTAVTMVTGPVKGCYISNPLTAADQNIVTAEVAYVNPVTTATTTGRGTNQALQPGQTFYCIPGQTTNVSVNAATSSHALTVVVW